MRLRKLLIAGAAVAAAGALTLAPAAQANNPTGDAIQEVHVGANTSGSYATSLTLTSASVTMDPFGSPTNLGCSGGSAGGTVHAGSIAPLTAPASEYPFANITSLNLACDSFFPGADVSMSIPDNGCVDLTLSDPNVHDGLSDTGPKGGKFDVVDGFLNVDNSVDEDCVVTVVYGPCTITLAGSTELQFDEATGAQQLILKGNGLEVVDAGFLCLGMYGSGDPVTLNNVTFDMTATGGDVDVRPAP